MDWKHLEISQAPPIWSHILLAPALVRCVFLLLAVSVLAQWPVPAGVTTPVQLSQNAELVGQTGGPCRVVTIS